MITLTHYTTDKSQPGETPLIIPNSAKTLDDLTRELPAGVYTTFRTFHKSKILNLNMHVERLERSAQLKSRKIYIDRQVFRAYLRAAIAAHPAPENRVRVIVNWDSESKGEAVFLAVEDLRVPDKELYINGARAKTIHLNRNNPEAKATEFIQQTSHLRGELTNGLNELLMVDENGVILEGLSSNFFAIRQETVYTNQAGVLPGITREMVLTILRDREIPVVFEGIRLEEINRIQEAFITSASRGVLPLVQIDDTVIGSGLPGPLTQPLMKAYEQAVEERVEPI